MNRAQNIIAQINEMFQNKEEEINIELIEGSLPGQSRFSLRMYHPQTQKLLFKAHASNKGEIRSLLANAAKHLKTGGLDKVRVSVQDNKHGLTSDHGITNTANGHHISNLTHVDSFED